MLREISHPPMPVVGTYFLRQHNSTPAARVTAIRVPRHTAFFIERQPFLAFSERPGGFISVACWQPGIYRATH